MLVFQPLKQNSNEQGEIPALREFLISIVILLKMGCTHLMVPRHVKKILKDHFSKARSLLLLGARQTGKTTLARSTFPRLRYVSLENPDEFRFSQEDPKSWLAQFPKGAVLDEIHRVPSLFSWLQGLIDEKKIKFVLTGSQNILLMEKTSQTLAGRMSILTLPPLTQAEINGHPSKPPEDSLFNPHAPAAHPRGNLLDSILRGGYPEPVTKPANRSFWFSDYIHTYVERNVRQLLNVKDLLSFQRFLSLCAGRSGQILNKASLANDAGLSHGTVGHWLSVLQTSGLVYLLAPYHKNFNKRIIKSPKLYFLDTGLLCRLLGIHQTSEIQHHPLLGAIFETFVVSEIRKTLFNLGREPNLFFWRDQNGLEVDLLVPQGPDFLPLEIKLGQTISGDSFKNLHSWRETTKTPNTPASFLYGGDNEHQREGITVKSWRSL